MTADGPRVDQPMANPMTPAEVAAATPDTTADRVAKINRSGVPMASSPRRSLGRDVAIVTGVGAGILVTAATAAALATGNENVHGITTPASTAPVTQEGQTPTAYASLETQTGNPITDIQQILKTNVNEYYNGTISFNLQDPDHPFAFTAVDPDHPNNQQTVDLSQVEELCGTSIPQGSHIDSLGLTNALIASNKDAGTIMILMDGMVNGQRVVLEVPWNPQTVTVENKGLFVNTQIEDFSRGNPAADPVGDPVVSDPNGKPQEGNQFTVDMIDDQPVTATAGQ